MNFQEFSKIADQNIVNIKLLLQSSICNEIEGLKSKLDEKSVRLDEIEHQIATSEFTVGVVGVFNSGKTTLLNALMRQDILSTAIVPETATLTSIRFEETPRTIIHFWSKEEWKEIEERSTFTEDLKKLLDDLLEHSTEKISKYIKEESLSLEVTQTELQQFTSANADESLALLVREVELFMPLDLCKENITIVDTPGLNDPVKARERITEEHLRHCDLIVFLTFANHAFTNFDKEFLQRQEAQNNIHKMFVLVNQIDALKTPKDVELVLKHTQKNLKNSLQNKENTEFEIFPTSGEQALLHYVRDSNLQPIMSLEDSGVPQFEERLRQFLFEGERAQTLQKVIQSKIMDVTVGYEKFLETFLKTQHGNHEKQIEQCQKAEEEYNEVDIQLQRLEQDIQRELSVLSKTFDQAIRSMEREIILSKSEIQVKSFQLVDDWLATKWGIGAALDVEKWVKSEFASAVGEEITKQVEKSVQNVQTQISDAVEQFGSEMMKSYKRVQRDLTTHIPDLGNVLLQQGGEFLLDAAINAVITLVIREILILVAAEVSASVAAIILGITTGPVGWAILAGIGLITIFQQDSGMKNKIKSSFEKEIPKVLNDNMGKIATDVLKTFVEEKQKLLDSVYEASMQPAKSIMSTFEERKQIFEIMLQNKENSLQKLKQWEAHTLEEKDKLNKIIEELKLYMV